MATYDDLVDWSADDVTNLVRERWAVEAKPYEAAEQR
jgi:hypothetical protein